MISNNSPLSSLISVKNGTMMTKTKRLDSIDNDKLKSIKTHNIAAHQNDSKITLTSAYSNNLIYENGQAISNNSCLNIAAPSKAASSKLCNYNENLMSQGKTSNTMPVFSVLKTKSYTPTKPIRILTTPINKSNQANLIHNFKPIINATNADPIVKSHVLLKNKFNESLTNLNTKHYLKMTPIIASNFQIPAVINKMTTAAASSHESHLNSHQSQLSTLTSSSHSLPIKKKIKMSSIKNRHQSASSSVNLNKIIERIIQKSSKPVSNNLSDLNTDSFYKSDDCVATINNDTTDICSSSPPSSDEMIAVSNVNENNGFQEFYDPFNYEDEDYTQDYVQEESRNGLISFKEEDDEMDEELFELIDENEGLEENLNSSSYSDCSTLTHASSTANLNESLLFYINVLKNSNKKLNDKEKNDELQDMNAACLSKKRYNKLHSLIYTNENPEEKRTYHILNERQRRNDLRILFEILRSQLPILSNQAKASKLTILKTSIEYVKEMSAKNEKLQSLFKNEKSRHQMLMEQLEALQGLDLEKCGNNIYQSSLDIH